MAHISKFTDVSADAWYADTIATCWAAGILNGTSDVTVSPTDLVTREQMFAAFARVLDVEPADTTGSELTDMLQGI